MPEWDARKSAENLTSGIALAGSSPAKMPRACCGAVGVVRTDQQGTLEFRGYLNPVHQGCCGLGAFSYSHLL